jgi:RimJ/RimL family protein N-acetyltransferase
MGAGINADHYAGRAPRRLDTIRTARLVMRRWRDAEREAFAVMNADPVVMREASQAVMRRLGMTPYARFDHPRIAAGHPVRPHIAYRLQRARPGPAHAMASRPPALG